MATSTLKRPFSSAQFRSGSKLPSAWRSHCASVDAGEDVALGGAQQDVAAAGDMDAGGQCQVAAFGDHADAAAAGGNACTVKGDGAGTGVELDVAAGRAGDAQRQHVDVAALGADLHVAGGLLLHLLKRERIDLDDRDVAAACVQEIHGVDLGFNRLKQRADAAAGEDQQPGIGG